MADAKTTTTPPTESPTAPESQALVPAPAARVPVNIDDPRDLEELYRFVKAVAPAEVLPKALRGRPADILVVVKAGREMGLSFMASVQGLAVINGIPSPYGKTMLAVIVTSPVYKDHDEYYVVNGERREHLAAADLARDDTSAVTTFWRKDNPRPRTATFSVADAKKAGLWGKAGPWSEYTARMLKMRARGFAASDAFPDVLKGLRLAEEVQDDPPPPA